MSGVLCLKWNNHSPTFLKTLDNFRTKELYCDATIVCHGKYYPVHKLALSTCSTYFEEIFERAECKHPFIVLKDMECPELEALLNYMYKGEVNVLQEMLPGLIRAAESLKVKGLAVSDDDPTKEETTKPKKRSNTNSSPSSLPKKSRRLEDKKSYSTSLPPKNNENSNSNEQLDSQTVNPNFNSINHNLNFLNNVLEEVNSINRQSPTKSIERKSAGSSGSKIKERPERQDDVFEVEEIDVKSEPFEVQENADGYVGPSANSVRPQSNEDKEESLFGTLLSPQMSRSGSEEHLNEGLSSEHHLPLPQCSSWSDNNAEQDVDDDCQDEICEIEPYVNIETATGEYDDYDGDEMGDYDDGDEDLSVSSPFPLTALCIGDVYSTAKGTGPTKSSTFKRCSQCSYRTKYRTNMKKHVIRMHTAEQPFTCSQCSYRSSTNESLKVHMRKHTGEKPYDCHLCSYKAAYFGSMKKHLMGHTGEKPFRCNRCSYKSIQKNSLVMHMRLHKD